MYMYMYYRYASAESGGAGVAGKLGEFASKIVSPGRPNLLGLLATGRDEEKE